MNEQNIMVFIYMTLAMLGGLGLTGVYWSTTRKALEGADELLGVMNRERFMRTMRAFLDTRLSRNPLYSARPPQNNLEVQGFYRKWMYRFYGNHWKVVLSSSAIPLFGGFLAMYEYTEKNIVALIYMLFCTILVILFSLLIVSRIKKRCTILITIDERLTEMTAPDRTALAQRSREEQDYQAYVLRSIDAIPVLATNEDIANNPRCMGEASTIVRGGLAFIAGLGFFLCMVFIGVVTGKSTFPIFLITGLIGIPVTCISLLIFWEDRRKKLAKARGWKMGATEPQQSLRSTPYFPPSPLPQISLPRFSPPQEEGIVCSSCGEVSTRDAEFCLHCGQKLSPA